MLSFPSWSPAKWAEEKDAPYSIVYSKLESLVQKSGLSTETGEEEMQVLNEAGRNELVLYKLGYDPDTTQMRVLSASSVTDGREVKVDLKKITTKDVGTKNGGISGVRQIIIPYTNLKIGSHIKFKYKSVQTKTVFKGFYDQMFSFGLKAPEQGGEAFIKSEIPLYFSVSDPWHILQIHSGKEGKYYTFSYKQTKPLYKSPLEYNPILKNDTITFLEVVTIKEWKNYVSEFAKNYESVLNTKKLPTVFEKIVENAKKKKDVHAQIDFITSHLSNMMTYSGDWTSLRKQFFPKPLSAIAKSKTGDCKDFATATVAMLRELGLNANVALTFRKSPSRELGIVTIDPTDPQIPSARLFNHAIVKVNLSDHDPLWVDPTNIVSDSSFVFEDIAGSPALEISPKTESLEWIPYPSAEQSKISYEKDILIKADDSAESTTRFSLTGDASKGVLETAFQKNTDEAQKILMLLTSVDAKTAKSFYSGVNLKQRVSSLLEGQQKSIGEKIASEKKEKKYLYIGAPPSLFGLGLLSNQRKTAINMQSLGSQRSKTRVHGYDLADFTQGCTILTPWFDVQRRFLKISDGFEVQDEVDFKKTEISAKDVNSDKLQMALSDAYECIRSADIEVVKLSPSAKMTDRLKKYTYAVAKENFNKPGPQSIEGSRMAVHILDQILTNDPKNKNALILKARALRRVGYKSERVDRTEYLDKADSILDQLLVTYPNDPELARQKTWSAYYRHDSETMKKNFQRAYALSAKDYDLFILGGSVCERMKNLPVALGSYSKARDLAKTPAEKSDAASSIGEVYFRMHQLEKAIAFYKESIQLDSSDAWVQGRLMDLLENAGRYDEEIALGEQIMKTSPYGVARRTLADAYARKASTAKAAAGGLPPPEQESLFLKGLSYDSTNAACLLGLAQWYSIYAQNKNDPEMAQKAITYVEKAKATGKIKNLRTLVSTKTLHHILAGKNSYESERSPAADNESQPSMVSPASATDDPAE